MSSAIAALAAAHGIAAEYHDVWGGSHGVSEATQRALLGAMGIAVATDVDAQAALAAHAAARDTEGLPPLVVLREAARPWTLRLRVPAHLADQPLTLTISPEGGGERMVRLAAVHARTAPIPPACFTEITLGFDATLPPGYHELAITAGHESVARTCLAIAPASCYLPAPPRDARTFGPSAQLYGIRSARNWGIGDFSDLATLAGQWGARGAGVVGVSPLHALFPHAPQHASPYSPSSRLFRNVLYIDVEAVAEYAECEDARAEVLAPAFQAELARLRATDLVDYVAVATLKQPVLEMLHAHFRATHLARGDARANAFHHFVAREGEALRRHALFEALQEAFHSDDANVWGWPVWPAAYRDPQGPAVAEFARTHAQRLEHYQYLQWQAELQFAAAAAAAAVADMSIGLYTDLAVSVNRGGAEAWANQHLYALGASVGAPPDEFNMNGQDWGLPPLIPERLRAAGFAPWLATLRANMRHAGALRIDHVMGMARLFWVPSGGAPAEGAYVHYPFDELVALLALESHRHRCMVIGEDLGTVSDDLRAALSAHAVLSYRVLMFERDPAGDFRAPEDYPSGALVTFTTHDLPTLAGWWSGDDIALRSAHGATASDADRDAQLAERALDRERLVAALARADILPREPVGAVPRLRMRPALARAVQAFLARTPARLMVVPLEDVLGVEAQANLPGTLDSYPNWQRKLPLPLEAWPDDARFTSLARTLQRLRPRPRQVDTARNAPAHVPRATYRMQLNRDFTFADATAQIPYLAALGISHIYCSPYLRARAGSLHGYDIVDHASLNPEIGTRADFDRFVDVLDAHGMGHVCDVVPNHVGVMGADNDAWMDVLESGEASRFAEYFDIDWMPFDPVLAGRVLLPVLGEAYGTVLERGEIRLAFEADKGVFAFRYFDHRFPLDPSCYAAIVRAALDTARSALPAATVTALDDLLAVIIALPPRSATTAESIALRRRDIERIKAGLRTLAEHKSAFATALEPTLAALNGHPGEPASFEALHALLERQAYRLAYWRVASDEINYRRFFDINDLAALRMENDRVFSATHGFILDLAATGRIHGLRIDHPDGLFDPARYFIQLQRLYATRVMGTRASLAGELPPLYVVLEKIAASHERLPERWPVSGMTGYRFANLVNGLFVDSAARGRLDRAWRAFVGPEADTFAALAMRGKRAIMRGPLASELTLLANRALRVARGDRRTRDFTFNLLRQAIADVVTHFPVYRTYVDAQGSSAQDRRYVDWAVTQARRASRAADRSVFEFLRSLMLATPPEGAPQARRDEFLAFAQRFQQFTAPVMAKGIEDTAFYVFNRLVALNDVGGNPDEFGTTVRAFHGASRDRMRRWPVTMLATSTHDNKRSEDVRTRIDVISEFPAGWRLAVRRWSRMNRSRKHPVEGGSAPSANDEYLLYQTLVGTFPPDMRDDAALAAYRTRIQQYMLKAVREAKVHTSWLAPDEGYEEALAAFVNALLAGEGDNRFLDDLRTQVLPFAWFGRLNSVSMALLKFASPGVPDLYQGSELLDLRLVDPDNRVAVDYGARATVLAELDALADRDPTAFAVAVPIWFATPMDGRAKLFVTAALLRLRTRMPDVFGGEYVPIVVHGSHAGHVVALARQGAGRGVLIVAGRLFASLGPATGVLPLGAATWADTTLDVGFLPQGTRLTDVLSGLTLVADEGRLAMADVFHDFPGAVLTFELADPGVTRA